MADFVFVVHKDSPGAKRITDAAARKTIRGQAMHHVRKNEKLQGKKRLSGRRLNHANPKPNPPIPPTPRAVPESPLTGPSSVSSTSQSAAESPLTGPSSVSSTSQSGQTPQSTFSHTPSHQSTSSVEQGDEKLYENLVDNGMRFLGPSPSPAFRAQQRRKLYDIIYYTLNEFMATVLPVKPKNPVIRLGARAMFAQNLRRNEALFFGHLTTAAAHRAIFYNTDPKLLYSNCNLSVANDPYASDYIEFRDHALKAMARATRRDRGSHDLEVADLDAIETFCTLVNAACTTGDFREAALHLQAVEDQADRTGIPTTKNVVAVAPADRKELSEWIHWTDLKLAVGLMSRPHFPLSRETMATAKLSCPRILPDPTMPIARLATSFGAVECLSKPLRDLLVDIREVFFFLDFDYRDPIGLEIPELLLIRPKSLVIEYSLVRYAYYQFQAGEGEDDLHMHCIEHIGRLAALAIMNTVSLNSIPASGVGRALTHKLQLSYEACRTQNAHSDPNQCDLLIWALFIAAAGSYNRPERPFFVEHLAKLMRPKGWTTWTQVEELLLGFLYIPSVHGETWNAVWEETREVNVPLR